MNSIEGILWSTTYPARFTCEASPGKQRKKCEFEVTCSSACISTELLHIGFVPLPSSPDLSGAQLKLCLFFLDSDNFFLPFPL